METNINILSLNKHFLHNKKDDSSNNYHNKIVNYSHFSINEANICHKIKKIPYYSNFFSILEDYEPLNISELNDDIIEKLKDVNDIQYYLFTYNDKGSYDFIDFLYNSTCIKKLIKDTINSFQHLLYGLHVLNDNNICFFDISSKNIIFLENYREKPVFSNFKFSLHQSNLHYTYISHILNKMDDFTYQPFEIHILYYFIKHKMITISYSFIEEFCEEYINNLTILSLFSENYKNLYKEQCIETMRKYINRPRKEILDDILERNEKWDVYGISILFIHIFGCISRIFSLKGTFISKITMELTKNIHPDSDKRMSLEDTLNMFNSHLNEQKDWSFVNNLDNNKLSLLFDEFSK
jgi:hypothetical protein